MLNIIFENKHIDGPKHKLDRLNAPKYHSLLDHFKEYGYEVKLETEEDTHITLFKTITIDKEIRKKYIDEILSKRFTLVSRERLENCYHQCKKFMNTNYSFVECGVAKGGSLAIMKVAAGKNNKIFGFDSFEGLPEKWRDGFEKGAFNRNGQFPPVNPNVELIKGWFNETLEDFMKTHNKKVSFLHIDADLYSSTKYILDTLKPHLDTDCIVIFDELVNYPGFDGPNGELRAFYEFITENKVEYEWIGMNGTPTGLLGYYHENVALIIHSAS